jgi:hypothetical protein
LEAQASRLIIPPFLIIYNLLSHSFNVIYIGWIGDASQETLLNWFYLPKTTFIRLLFVMTLIGFIIGLKALSH